MQFEIVDVTNGSRLVEAVTGLTIIQIGAAILRQARLAHVTIDLFKGSTVKDRCLKAFVELLTGPSEHGLVYLTQIHTGRHTQRVENDVDRRTVCQERHIFGTHNLRNNTLVTVTTGHLITDTQFALHGDIYLGHLDDATRQIITHSKGKLVAREATRNLTIFNVVIIQQLFNQVVGFLIGSPLIRTNLSIVDSLQRFGRELDFLRDYLFTMVGEHTVGHFAIQQDEQTRDELVFQLLALVTILFFRLGKQFLLTGTGLTVTNHTGKELLINNNTVE